MDSGLWSMARISEKDQRGTGIKETCCTREMNYSESITDSPRRNLRSGLDCLVSKRNLLARKSDHSVTKKDYHTSLDPSRIRGVVANYLASQVRDPGIDSHQHLKDS